MTIHSPTIFYDPREELPPANRQLFVYDTEMDCWWNAQYFPNPDIDEYQPNACHLAGLEFTEPHVSHWMFQPPAP
jgi:hypothetical protein